MTQAHFTERQCTGLTDTQCTAGQLEAIRWDYKQLNPKLMKQPKTKIQLSYRIANIGNYFISVEMKKSV